MSIFDWSKTASSNGNADANINFQEGQAPSTVNDSARALMARIAYWRDWFAGNITQSGASNAYTMTSGESLSAYTAGMRFLWKPNADSTGAVTLNLDSIGAKKVYLPDGTQAGSGDIDADALYDVVYQTTLDSSAGGFKIVGAPDGSTLAANLQAIAALTPTDGGFIVGDGSTFVIESGATARTSLGLGTSATVNTGTSGATVPLLSTANSWGDTQTATRFQVGSFIMDDNIGLGADIPGFNLDSNDWLVFYRASNRLEVGIGAVNAFSVTGSGSTILGNTIWHAGNDGAGSGLDADTLDGVQGSAYGQLASTQTWSAANTFSAQDPIRLSAAAGTARRIYFQTSGTLRWSVGVENTSESGSNAGSNFQVLSFTDAGSLVGTVLSITRSTMAATFGGALAATTIHARPLASTETTGTLTSASANKTIIATGGITLPASVFSAGDMLTIDGGGTARTITRGSGLTMYVNGTDSATATLTANGVMGVWYRSATVCILTGNVS